MNQLPPKDQIPYQYVERPNDEIDLVDLLRGLWANRLLISVITLVALAVALVYVYITPPTYQSTAVYTPPSVQQVRSMVSWELQNYEVTPETVFNEFKAKLASDQVRIAFYEEQILGADHRSQMDEDNFIRSYRDFLKMLDVQHSGPKDPIPSVTVSMEDGNAVEVSKTLRSFIAFVNQEALQALKQNYEAVRNSQAAELKSKIDSLKFQAQRMRELRLQELEEALLVAKTLNLKNSRIVSHIHGRVQLPDGQGSSVSLIDPPLYWLGTDELMAQIAAIKTIDYTFYQSEELPALESEYRHVRSASVDTEKGLAYTEQTAPLPHYEPVKPKKALILALALVAGLMVGVMVALIRSAFTRRTEGAA